MSIIGKYLIVNGTIREKFDYTYYESNSDSTLVYEVFRIEDRISLFLEDHIQRLINSLKRSNIKIPFIKEEITKLIDDFIQKINIINGNIKISCFCLEKSIANYYIHFIPTYYPSAKMYKDGVATILLHAERENPNIKIANTSTRNKANSELDKKHMFEALLVNHNNLITEGSRTNVFFVSGNKIITAPDQIVLPGIIRSKVIDIIEESDFELIRDCLSVSELINTEAAFLTGTSPRILPIKNIDGIRFNADHPIVRNLMSRLNDVIETYKIK